jgi:hypothetical protein
LPILFKNFESNASFWPKVARERDSKGQVKLLDMSLKPALASRVNLMDEK